MDSTLCTEYREIMFMTDESCHPCAGAIPPLAWDDAMQVINGSCMSARSRIRDPPTEFECLCLHIMYKYLYVKVINPCGKSPRRLQCLPKTII